MRIPQWTRHSIRSTLLMLMLTSPSMGGQLATFTEPQRTNGTNHRQNVCDRHAAYQNGSVPLEDSLAGMKLNVLTLVGEYFFYDEKTGIDTSQNPGIVEVLLDELARRAGFTWRDSFAVSYVPTDGEWTELLEWGAESYDMTCDWWDPNLSRLQSGIQFITPWYDSSLILITKKVPEVVSDEIILTNWLLPYETNVWLLTIFTVILSGLLYQWIEWLQNERGDRSLWEWWLENCYMSALNFTQSYEFQPKSFAGRLFGVSLAIWALVMTATYTANLASLLVKRKPASIVVVNMEQAAVHGFPICVLEGTNADIHVKEHYPSARRIMKQSEDDLYNGLQIGDCKFIVTSMTSYEKYKNMRTFNPKCDLQWVSEPLYKIAPGSAGFAMKGDAGRLCSGLITQVINYHMESIIDEGVLKDMWALENQRYQTIDCDLFDPTSFLAETAVPLESTTEAPGSRVRQRDLMKSKPHHASAPENRILLKAAKGAAAGAVAEDEEPEAELGGDQLTMNQMIGIFVFLWGAMAISTLIAFWNISYNKYLKRPICEALNWVGHATGCRLCVKDPGGLSNDTCFDSKDCKYDPKEDGSSNTKPTLSSLRQSCLTNDTASWDEARERSDESVPKMSQELVEMRMFQLKILEEQRTFQLKILEEQRAMHQQMCVLTAALAAFPAVANVHEGFTRDPSITTSHHPSKAGVWQDLDV